MPKGIIALGIWCVDTAYLIKELPLRGKLEHILESKKCVGGGPSNVLTNLNSMGFKYPKIAMGSLGNDENANYIIKHCKKNQIETKHFVFSKKLPTSQSICMIERQKERTFFYQSGANELLDYKHFKISRLRLSPKILYIGYLTLLGKLDHFDQYNTRLCNILSRGRKKNMITVVDLASNRDPFFQKIVFSALKNIDYLLLNETEAELLFKKTIVSQKKKIIQKLAIDFSKKLFLKGLKKAIVIHSPAESLYISSNEVIHTKSVAIHKKKIINSVGAGDAFCAAFIYGIHESWDIKKTLKKAHAAGSTMMKVGSSSGNLPNIQKL